MQIFKDYLRLWSKNSTKMVLLGSSLTRVVNSINQIALGKIFGTHVTKYSCHWSSTQIKSDWLKKIQKYIQNIQKLFNFFTCTLPYCVAHDHSNFEKVANLKIWQLVSFWGVKTHFGKIPLKWWFFRHAFFSVFTNVTPVIVIVPSVVSIVSRWYFDHFLAP